MGDSMLERVRNIIEEQLGDIIDREEIVESASLRDDLGVDSLDAVELVMACEDEFNLGIPLEDMDACRTVGDVVRYLDGRMAAKAGK